MICYLMSAVLLVVVVSNSFGFNSYNGVNISPIFGLFFLSDCLFVNNRLLIV